MGSPVLPDVYWMSAGSSGRGDTSGAPVSLRAKLGADTTAASVGSLARRSLATARASGNVIRARGRALRRMPVCRLAYSSMRSRRSGG